MKRILIFLLAFSAITAYSQLEPKRGLNIVPYTASGTNTYTVTFTGITNIKSGDEFRITFTNGNTAASTINGTALVKNPTTALTSGDLAAGGTYIVRYTGTNFQVLNIAGSGGGGVPTSRLINTTAPLTGGGDLTADITISMPAATTSISGHLTSTDWNTFNSKQNTGLSWLLGSGGTATGVNTKTFNAPSWDNISQTWTATANSQYGSRYNYTLTSRASASDFINSYYINSSVTSSAATINATGLTVESLFNLVGGVVSTGTVSTSGSFTGLTIGTYPGVLPTTSGSGTGATYTATVSSSTAVTFALTAAGSGYRPGESLTFSAASFGGGTGTITLYIATVTGNSFSATSSAIRIFNSQPRFAGQVRRYLDFVAQDTYGATPGTIFAITSQTTSSGDNINFVDFAGLNIMSFNNSGSLIQLARPVSISNAATFSVGTSNSTFSGQVINNTTISTGNQPYRATGATIMNTTGTLASFSTTTTLLTTGVNTLGTITGGSGYTNNTYLLQPLTGGTGSGATANIIVTGGAVTSVILTASGTGYTAGDVLSASIPAGSGFSIPVATLGNLSGDNAGFFDNRTLADPNSPMRHVGFYSRPTYNQTASATGSLYGFWYNPIRTAVIGTEYAFRGDGGITFLANASGDTPTGSTKFEVRGLSGGTNIARFATSANTAVLRITDTNITDEIGTLLGTKTTQNVYNTTATTGNLFGAATTLTIGATTGTLNLRNVTLTAANATSFAMNGASPSITTSSTGTASVFNAAALTGNIFGAATTVTIGATTGTLNLRNVTLTAANATSFAMNGASPSITSTSTGTGSLFNTNILTGAQFGATTSYTLGGTPTGSLTANFFANATASGNTKTLNFGTAGASGSTTNISIGSLLGGGQINLNEKVFFQATEIAAGTTGNQTINLPMGSVNFAAAATSLVVTNSLATITSNIIPFMLSNDATAKSASIVRAAGSFTIHLNAAATAETRVGFVVFN